MFFCSKRDSRRVVVAFRPLCRKISKGDITMTEPMWRRLCTSLDRITATTAKLLYSDLCCIQLTKSGQTLRRLDVLEPLMDRRNPNFVHFFQKVLIENGRIVELIADIIDIPNPSVRNAKNSARRLALEETAISHKLDSEWNAKWSCVSCALRKENLASYETVRGSLSAAIAERPLKEWEQVIMQSTVQLSTLPATFWYAVQVAGCSLEEKGALCHKLALCRSTTTGPSIHRILHQLKCDLFVSCFSKERL